MYMSLGSTIPVVIGASIGSATDHLALGCILGAAVGIAVAIAIGAIVRRS